MLFVLQTPSLQHLAGVKTTTHLWNQPDIINKIAASFNGLPAHRLINNDEKWKTIEDKVRSKISALPLPGSCKKEMLHFVKAIGTEIIAWCKYRNLDGYTYKSLETLLPRRFCWSMHGTIDYAKTAELMVKDERMGVERRYEIACINCLEDEARQLFESMGDEGKREYVKMMYRTLRIMDHQHLVFFFTFILTGDDVQRVNSFFQSTHLRGASVYRVLFESALENGDGRMCEYWFTRLSRGEKAQVLSERGVSRYPSSSLLYYLSLLNKEQQRRQCKYDLFTCLLAWPLQPLFMGAWKCGWQLMDARECGNLLFAIAIKFCRGARDYDYCQLFWECWSLISTEYKQHFLRNAFYFEGSIKIKLEEIVKVILNEAPSRVILELVYDKTRPALMDESAISDAALMECKETASLNSSSDKDNMKKLLRSQYVSRLVDIVMESRIKNREITGMEIP